MARPTKLTASVKECIVSAVAAGNYYEPACVAAGIDYHTFRNWMVRGEKESKRLRNPLAKPSDEQVIPFLEFFQAITIAEARSEIELVAIVRDNPRLALDLLARRHSDRWGPKERHVVQGDAERPLTIRTLTVNVPLLAGNDEILLLTEGDGDTTS